MIVIFRHISREFDARLPNSFGAIEQSLHPLRRVIRQQGSTGGPNPILCLDGSLLFHIVKTLLLHRYTHTRRGLYW